MVPAFDYGDAVRVIRNVRNDGTYPGTDTGQLLIRRGSVGYVRNMGVFLQDQIIYSVHFVDQGGITVGCREPELIRPGPPTVLNFATRSSTGFRWPSMVRSSLPKAVRGKSSRYCGRSRTERNITFTSRDEPCWYRKRCWSPGKTDEL